MSSSLSDAGTGRGLRWLALGLLAAPALAVVFGCHSLNFNPLTRGSVEKKSEPTAEAAAEKPAPPSKYSFRLAPYAFYSDFPIERDQDLFRDLASLRDQVYRELLLPGNTADVRVYLFESKERYERYMRAAYPKLPPRRAFFIAVQRQIGGGEDLLVWTYWSPKIHQDLRHELTHALLHSVMKTVPIWLDEALAEYFELPTGNEGTNPIHIDLLRAEGARLDLARLEGLREVDDMRPQEYREAWAWAHLMLRSEPEAKTVLVRYLTYLQQFRGENPAPLRPLLVNAFPDPELALRQHLGRLEARIRSVRAQAPTLQPTAR